MKLVDVYVTLDGHLMGPFVALLPADRQGDDIVPAAGMAVAVAFRSHDQRAVSTWATAKLLKST